MKRYLALLIATLLIAPALRAQLTVAEECTLRESDLTAFRLNDNEPYVMDGDTIPFAIVRIGLTEPDAIFENKLGFLKQEYKDNEYWVYFAEGVKSVTVKTKRFTPLHYKFPEPLKAKRTYTMSIHRPEGAKYKGTLNISSNVPQAKVYIDGTKVSDGTPFTYTGDAGPHKVELKADGYDPQTREVDLPMSQSLDININLYAAGSLSVGGVGYGLAPVEATAFAMGNPGYYYTSPVRTVSLHPFSMGSTLVSVDLWEAVLGAADDRIKGPRGEVVNVSFDEVQDFIFALNQATGKEFRLPTEAEWEYMVQNAGKYGITDMGTRLEWCGDWFGKYNPNETIHPTGPAQGYVRVVRGGSEFTDTDPVYGQPYYRWRKLPDKRSELISFRLVQDN